MLPLSLPPKKTTVAAESDGVAVGVVVPGGVVSTCCSRSCSLPRRRCYRCCWTLRKSPSKSPRRTRPLRSRRRTSLAAPRPRPKRRRNEEAEEVGGGFAVVVGAGNAAVASRAREEDEQRTETMMVQRQQRQQQQQQ